MKELDEYLKICNLVFTDTVNRLAFCTNNFNLDKAQINYNESISFLVFVSSFNILYQSFQKEYDELPKLNLGKYVEALDFSKFNFDKDCYRVLRLYINKPLITNHGSTILYLREINDEILPYVTNGKNPYDKKYYHNDIKLDDEIVKKYLDLFEKYQLLLEAYNYLKNQIVFGDGTHCVFTRIDEYNKCNLLDGLHKFKLSFGSAYFDTEYFTEISINLGDNFGIDHDNCKMYVDNKEISIEKKEYDKILTNMYINKKHTKERKKQSF